MTAPEPRFPRLVPVLDVKNGQVVRAIGGRRADYKPLASNLTSLTDPPGVADVLLRAAAASELYVADLDAIAGADSVQKSVQTLIETSTVPVWLDAGFGVNRNVRDLAALPFLRGVIGFETCPKPDYLAANLDPRREGRVAFSVDLRDETLLGNWRGWGLQDERDAIGLVRAVVGLGCHSLIVLDLSRVGTGTGTGTEDLLASIRSEFPTVELIAGGGVRSWADVDHLGELGVDAVLVASALHDRTIRYRPRR